TGAQQRGRGAWRRAPHPPIVRQEIRNGDGGRMRVEIRPAARLRGTNAVALLPALGPALDAAIAAPELDLAPLRVTADWVQYQRSFRPPVMLVPTTGGDALEL